MEQYLRWTDTDTTGNRNHVTPPFAHPTDFTALVDDLVACIAGTPIDLVACIDSLGFILGTAIAQRLIETGAQVAAAIPLIEGRGGTVAGIATVNMDDNDQTASVQGQRGVRMGGRGLGAGGRSCLLTSL